MHIGRLFHLIINYQYDLYFNNVKVHHTNIAFDIGQSWTYKFDKCRVEYAQIGFDIKNGTSGSLMSCVAFNCSSHGFKIEGTNYVAFIGCGSDKCDTALEVVGVCRGLTFSSWGMENCTSRGIVLSKVDACVTFTGINIGTHFEKNVDLIVCHDGNATFTDMRYTSGMAVAPPNKFITVTKGYITLINCYLTGENLGDLDKCNIIGGMIDNKLQNSLDVPSITSQLFTSLTGKTQTLATDVSEYIFTAEKDSSYICSAVVQGNGLQYCYQIVSTCNVVGSNSVVIDMGTKALCEFTIDSENRVHVKNKAVSGKVYKWSVLKIR